MSTQSRHRKRVARAKLRLLALHPDACPICKGRGWVGHGPVVHPSMWARVNCSHCDATGKNSVYLANALAYS